MKYNFGDALRRRRTALEARRRRSRVPRFEPLECRQLLAADLAITEFMASNDTTLSDSDGAWPDWIEIHNRGAEQVDLAGWTLTDDASNLDKWEFPSLTVDPGQYRVVFASGKDRKSVSDPLEQDLHSNFKLSADGEYVALVSPTGTVVSEFGPDGSDYPLQFSDVSYGLPADGGEPGYLASATPGAANSMQRSAPVEFDRSNGVFRDPFSLILSVDMPEATIHFTTDGSAPTVASPVYAGPITISATTHVQAIAVVPGLPVSMPRSAWFMTVDADLHNFSSDLPIVVFDNFDHGLPGEQAYQLNAMAIFEPSESSGRSSLLDEPTVTTRSGLRKRGSLSLRQAKANYALETWDEQNDDKDVSLLGMPSESDWVLYAPFDYDRAMLRNTFVFELSNQMGRYAPRTRYVEVYLNRTGGDVSTQDYYGVYVLIEKVKVGSDRVDIQKLDPQSVVEPEISGGWLLKIDPLDPGDQGFNNDGLGRRKIAYVDPKEVEVTTVQTEWIRDHLNEMNAALKDTDPDTGYTKYIDVDSWIDYHILNTFPMNTDAFRRSTYFSKDPGGKIEMGPLWDFNRSMEAADLPRDDNPEAWQNPGVITDYFGQDWWGDLFDDPNFMQKWTDRWFELRRDVLSTTHVESMIDTLASQVEEAQLRNFERWPQKPPRTADDSSYKAGPLDGTWEGEVAQMKAWVFNRLVWIDSQFVTPPDITPDAGHVSLGQEIILSGVPGSGVPGPIYYTTDGSDPRLPGGAVSPNAIMIDDDVTLVFSEPVTIVARATQEGEWSAPVTAQFLEVGALDDAADLAVTEINYHPNAPTDSERALGLSCDDFEFIELVNAGDHTIDLANVAFVDGFEFTFGNGETSLLAPDARVVVVANQDAFTIRYGTGLPVAGEFASGGLNKNSERIVLVDSRGVVIQDFTYSSTKPWPSRADGIGGTLEVIDTTGDYNAAENWRASSQYGGSPGEEGADPFSDVVLNEVLSRSGPANHDMVELANTTALPIDVSGWYLSDNRDDLMKWAFPTATTIPAGGYLVLDEQALDFALDGRSGGEVWLVEANRDTGQPLRFADHVAFAAAEAGVSLGRWPDGDHTAALFPMVSQTFEAANSGPAVGSLVISEVHYQPERYGENFNLGIADRFTPVLGQWTVAGGRYEVVPEGSDDTIATFSAFDTLPDEFQVAMTVNFPAQLSSPQNAALIFDFRNETDFKFASVHSDGWTRIGQRDASGWHVLNEFKWVVPSEVDLRIVVKRTGSAVRLLASGQEKVNWDFGGTMGDGLVGFGSNNSAARFDDVVVEPLDAEQFEFIELFNTTSGAVDLTGWQVNKPVGLRFAEGTTIGPEETLVLVGFDPTDAPKADNFRARFNITGSVRLVGPYPGKLGGGERLQLVRPVDSGGTGFVLVDRVGYEDTPPWPAGANGAGSSLQRIATNAFGDFATSWMADKPTPGATGFPIMGDMNTDGKVDSNDADALTLALRDPDRYQQIYGISPVLFGDMDRDGDFDFDDIRPFMERLDWQPDSSSIATPIFNQQGGQVASDFPILLINPNTTGSILYTLDGSDPRQLGGGINLNSLFATSTFTPVTLLSAGSRWRYLDDGSDQGSAWTEPGFNDATWSSGPAQLGYGDGDVATVVSYGGNASNKHITTYFRSTFQVTDVAQMTELTLRIVRDDGASVFLNGLEVARSNLSGEPGTPIDHEQFAAQVVGGEEESTFFEFTVPTSVLVEGENTIAVEVHQVSRTSSDISFDLELTGIRANDPIFLDESTTVSARVLDEGHWSALAEATFAVDTVAASAANLRLTEINYHPLDPTAEELAVDPNLDDNDFEFIELRNTGPDQIDLTGVQLSDAVTFDFTGSAITELAAGEHVLIVEDTTAFEIRYGIGLPIAGQWSGKLSNGGELVTLTDGSANIIHQFSYDDENGWPTTPDGDGPTLVVVDTEGDYQDPANWRASAATLGTPGTAPGLAGDADLDGDTDGADFLSWQRGFGRFASGATVMDGDFDTDGDVDDEDLSIWQVQFRATPSRDSAAGESLALLAFAEGPMNTPPQETAAAWWLNQPRNMDYRPRTRLPGSLDAARTDARAIDSAIHDLPWFGRRWIDTAIRTHPERSRDFPHKEQPTDTTERQARHIREIDAAFEEPFATSFPGMTAY